jgi:hypothetical protein
MQYYRISAEEWPTVSLARTLPRMTGKPECAGINRHVVGDARALQEGK